MLEDIFVNLSRKDEIFISKSSDVPTKFSDESQSGLFMLEDSSWWFKYRAAVIYNVFRKYLDPRKLTIDVGGGNGYTTNYLARKNVRTALLEPSYGACANAKKRGLKHIVCGTLSEADVKEKSIPQIMLLDVMEHIENDTDFLRLAYDKMIGGGKILITVPAMKILWSSEDDEAGHFRRYKRDELKAAVEKAGFTVEYINYFFEFAFLPVLLIRVFLEKIGILKRSGNRSKTEKKEISEKQFKERGGLVGFVLKTFESIELNKINKGKKIRFGSSLICVARKV